MPPSPAPPLYYNLSQRLLYTRPLPPCYAQLFALPPEAHPDPEDGLPASNAREIGMDEVDADEKPDENKDPGRDRGGRMAVEHDVRRGGYPTFSGGGLTDERAQVPTGVIERGSDGRILRFLGEDGGGVGPRTGTRTGMTTGTRRQGVPQAPPQDQNQTRGPGQDRRGTASTKRDGVTKAQARKSLLQPLAIPGGRPNQSQGQPAVVRTRDAGSNGARQVLPVLPRVKQPRRADPLTPIFEESVPAARPAPTRVLAAPAERSSIASLPPQFPLPPTRAKRESSASAIPTASHLPIPPNRGLPPPSQGPLPLPLPEDPPLPARADTVTLEAERDGGALPDPPAPLASPQPLRPTVRHSTSEPTAHSLAPPRTSPDPKVTVKPRGVRFDLSPTRLSPASPTPPTPRSGLRIPGTSFHLPIPFSTRSTPRRHSIASMTSVSSGGTGTDTDTDTDTDTEGEIRTARREAARPESFASVSSTGSAIFDGVADRPGMPARESSETRALGEEKAGLPRYGGSGRPQSAAVLGGGYLDGGRESRHRSPDALTPDQ